MDKNKTFELINPWSYAIGKVMTWEQIELWCKNNVHPNDQKAWMKEALDAANHDNCWQLGRMIIGS